MVLGLSGFPAGQDGIASLCRSSTLGRRIGLPYLPGASRRSGSPLWGTSVFAPPPGRGAGAPGSGEHSLVHLPTRRVIGTLPLRKSCMALAAELAALRIDWQETEPGKGRGGRSRPRAGASAPPVVRDSHPHVAGLGGGPLLGGRPLSSSSRRARPARRAPGPGGGARPGVGVMRPLMAGIMRHPDGAGYNGWESSDIET